jgi:hypothetical protein
MAAIYALPLDGRRGSKPQLPIEPMLGPEASAELRNRLVTELGGLDSGDAAALWAKRRLGEKNRLTASDARRVEVAFQAKLAGFGGPADEAGASASLSARAALGVGENRAASGPKLGGRRGGNAQRRGHQAIDPGPRGSTRASDKAGLEGATSLAAAGPGLPVSQCTLGSFRSPSQIVHHTPGDVARPKWSEEQG